MSFQDDISIFTAAQIIATLGCPRATAYCWLDGYRMPPEWQQPHWLAILKKHNKTVLATDTSRLAVKAGSKRKRG